MHSPYPEYFLKEKTKPPILILLSLTVKTENTLPIFHFLTETTNNNPYPFAAIILKPKQTHQHHSIIANQIIDLNHPD